MLACVCSGCVDVWVDVRINMTTEEGVVLYADYAFSLFSNYSIITKILYSLFQTGDNTYNVLKQFEIV